MAVVSGSIKHEDSIVAGPEIRARLDNYASGEYDYDTLVAHIKEICKKHADAVWETLSILDQYHRREVLTDEDFRRLKESANHIAFGPAPMAAKPSLSQPRSQAAGQTPPPVELRVAEDYIESDAKASTKSAASAPAAAEFDRKPVSTAQPPVHTAFQAVERAALQSHGREKGHVPHREPRSMDSEKATRRGSLQQGDVLRDRYVIDAVLSSGRTATVYRAHDRFRVNDAARPVAIKALVAGAGAAPARFEHELRTAQQFTHPNIVKVYDLDREGDLLFYSMELIEGRTLAELLRQSLLKRQQAMSILTQLANALSHLHERNFVHGDLHPGNVLISTTGQVKLLDFGAAIEQATSTPWLASAPTDAYGGLIYASCERLEGVAADKRDDIFSLSCIAYEMLSQVHPFQGNLATHARDTQQAPAPLSDLPPRQWHCLRQGLAWQREERPNSAKEWLNAFKAASAPPVLATPSHPSASITAHSPFGGVQEEAPRITADTRFGTYSPRAMQLPISESRTSVTWYLVLALAIIALLAFGFTRIDLGPNATPALANAQSALRETIDQNLQTMWQTLDRQLSTLRRAQPAPSPVTATPMPADTSAVHDGTQPQKDAPETGQVPSANTAPAKAIGGTQTTRSAVNPGRDASTDATASHPSSTDTANVPADTTGESHGHITFADDTYIVNKSEGAARIKIKREGGAAGKVAFMWWTEPDTAEIGKDFMSLGRKTETLGNGEREITVFVPLIVGADGRDRHVFFVRLGDPANGLSYGRTTRARVIILNQ